MAGPLNGSVQTFDASGNLTSQGGSANCGIPTYATSIAVNLTGITTTPGGFLRGWATGTPFPNATLLNYAPAINASNMVNIPLCTSTACAAQFNLRNFVGDVDVVADVLGYYVNPLYAQVAANGNPVSTSSVVSVTHTGTGQYDVKFNRRVDTCAISATAADTANRTASAVASASDVARVFTKDNANASQDTPFNVTVTC